MRFKKIKDRTDLELDQGVNDALAHCHDKGLDFYILLTGVDSYFERRRRKEAEHTHTPKGAKS